MSDIVFMNDYYPESNSEVTDEQRQIRERVRSFMSGDADSELISEIVDRVKNLVKAKQIDVICFAPGTTGAKTILRYGELAEELDKEVNCDVFLDAITLEFDADPITRTRYYQCNKDRVKGKTVLVVGGVYTTGESMRKIYLKLTENQVSNVYGLFVAKTYSAE